MVRKKTNKHILLKEELLRKYPEKKKKRKWEKDIRKTENSLIRKKIRNCYKKAKAKKAKEK